MWQQTDDASWSWHDSTLQELCHNRAGAYTEALVNYVQPLVEQLTHQSEWVVLDSCFGLGYNTWVFLEQLLQHASQPVNVHLYGIELDPLMWQRSLLVLQQSCFNPVRKLLFDQYFEVLDDLKLFSGPFAHNVYYRTQCGQVDNAPQCYESWVSSVIDRSTNNNYQPLTWTLSGTWGQISAYWVMGDLCETLELWNSSPPDRHCSNLDVVFHDAFSPRKVPALWSEAIFKQYAKQLTAKNGQLLTYSRARLVRDNLVSAGFELYDTEPLGGKRGGLLAKQHIVFHVG